MLVNIVGIGLSMVEGDTKFSYQISETNEDSSIVVVNNNDNYFCSVNLEKIDEHWLVTHVY